MNFRIWTIFLEKNFFFLLEIPLNISFENNLLVAISTKI
jgi:hypothetical protein